MQIRNPGYWMEKIRFRDPGWKTVRSGVRDREKHPGSATLVAGRAYWRETGRELGRSKIIRPLDPLTRYGTLWWTLSLACHKDKFRGPRWFFVGATGSSHPLPLPPSVNSLFTRGIALIYLSLSSLFLSFADRDSAYVSLQGGAVWS